MVKQANRKGKTMSNEIARNTYTVTLEVTADQPPNPDDFYIRWPGSINTVITSVKVEPGTRANEEFSRA